jgi:hypothetical protein
MSQVPSVRKFRLWASDLWYFSERWGRRSGRWLRFSAWSLLLGAALVWAFWSWIWTSPRQIAARARDFVEAIGAVQVEVKGATLRDSLWLSFDSITIVPERSAYGAAPTRVSRPPLDSEFAPRIEIQVIRELDGAELRRPVPAQDFAEHAPASARIGFRAALVRVEDWPESYSTLNSWIPKSIDPDFSSEAARDPWGSLLGRALDRSLTVLAIHPGLELDADEFVILSDSFPRGAQDPVPATRDETRPRRSDRSGAAVLPGENSEVSDERLALRLTGVRARSGPESIVAVGRIAADAEHDGGRFEGLWARGPAGVRGFRIELTRVRPGSWVEELLPTIARATWERLGHAGVRDVLVAYDKDASTGVSAAASSWRWEARGTSMSITLPAPSFARIADLEGIVRSTSRGLELSGTDGPGARCRILGLDGRIRGEVGPEDGELIFESVSSSPMDLLGGELPALPRSIIAGLGINAVLGVEASFRSAAWDALATLTGVELRGLGGVRLPLGRIRVASDGEDRGQGTLDVRGLAWVPFVGSVAAPKSIVRFSWVGGDWTFIADELEIDNAATIGAPTVSSPPGRLHGRVDWIAERSRFEGEFSWSNVVLDSRAIAARAVDGEVELGATDGDIVARGRLRFRDVSLPRAGPDSEALDASAGRGSWTVRDDGAVTLRASFSGPGTWLRVHGRVAPSGELDLACLLDRSESDLEAKNLAEEGLVEESVERWLEVRDLSKAKAWKLQGTPSEPVVGALDPSWWARIAPVGLR